jgi:hypothetical protein
MGRTLYGYARDSLSKRVLTVEAQREAIASVASRYGWPFEAERQFYADTASTYLHAGLPGSAGGGCPFASSPAGRCGARHLPGPDVPQSVRLRGDP